MGEQGFEIANMLVTPGARLLIDELVDAGDQHVLVMRAVENDDLPGSRRVGVNAPEKVMRGFEWSGLLEARDVDALRIDAAEHVPDRSVLAAGIQCLQDDQDRVFVLGVEQKPAAG